MALSRIESMWQIMAKTHLDIEMEETDNDLLCKICKKLSINVHVSSCGCSCCYSCITDYMSHGNLICPAGEDGHVMKDLSATQSDKGNLRVTRMFANCPNQSCNSKIELFEMAPHLSVCTKQLIACPYASVGCSHGIAEREIIVIHLRDESLSHTQMLMRIMTEMDAEVSKIREDLKASRLEVSSLREGTLFKDLQLEDIIEQMAEQKKELAAVREISRNQDIRISLLEEELIEVRNEMESRMSMMRGNSAA